jgi:putative transposase
MIFPPPAEEHGRGAAGVVTDGLRSYGAAHREVMPSVEHRRSKCLNNRTQDSRPAEPAA